MTTNIQEALSNKLNSMLDDMVDSSPIDEDTIYELMSMVDLAKTEYNINELLRDDGLPLYMVDYVHKYIKDQQKELTNIVASMDVDNPDWTSLVAMLNK